MPRDPEPAPEPGAAREPGAGREPDLDELARDANAAATRVSGAIAGGTLITLHGMVGFLTASLGLVAPGWAVGTLLVVWAVVGVAAWRGRARHPIVTMIAPLATAALVIGAVALGAATLGWSP